MFHMKNVNSQYNTKRLNLCKAKWADLLNFYMLLFITSVVISMKISSKHQKMSSKIELHTYKGVTFLYSKDFLKLSHIWFYHCWEWHHFEPIKQNESFTFQFGTTKSKVQAVIVFNISLPWHRKIVKKIIKFQGLFAWH